MDLISKVKVSDTSYEIKDGTARLAIVTLNNELNGKTDKVSNATSGNFAALDANGNLTDSGHKHSDYLTSAPVTSVNGETGDVTIAVPSASAATPQMDGTGAAGSASTYAKGDHVHPSDTSREARVITVSHGTSDTTFALTPNVLHTWGTVNSLTLTLASGSSTYVDGYWFKFTAGSSFTNLTMPSGVDWVTEPEIEAGKTYEVMIVDGLASYITDSIGDSVKAKTRIVNHGTSDTTYQLAPNEFHIWGEVASLTLTLKDESTGFVDGYWFRFTCGSTPTVLNLPSSVEWYYDEVEFEANHTYEVTIVEGKACYTDYASTTHIATKEWVQNNTQAPLESGVNIKTINGNSLLGEGNISISGGGGSGGGDVNIIEIVKVNGTVLTPDANKAVDVTVPTESTVTGWGFTKNSGTYSKPSGGIPKTDLASAVQTSLGLADTALQSAPVTSVNGQTGAVNLTIPAAVTESTVSGWGFTKNTGTYSKPSSGIPASDLAAGVIPTIPTNVSSFTNDAGYLTDENVVTIYSGSSAPSSSLGNNGDIYIQTA